MLKGVGTITVQVTDQEKALSFYTTKPGFEKRRDQPMGPGQCWLEVAPPAAQARDTALQSIQGNAWRGIVRRSNFQDREEHRDGFRDR